MAGSVTDENQEHANETGLYYYRARYYDPATGRFLSEDPIRFHAGFNFYQYVGSSPLNSDDPTGLSANDVQRILNRAQELTNEMTKNGERINGGSLNNLLSALQKVGNLFRKKERKTYKGCGQQVDALEVDLQFPKVPYDDKWTFKIIPVDRGFHQIGVASSNNPSDPDVVFDPWNNVFFTVPKGWSPGGPLSDTPTN